MISFFNYIDYASNDQSVAYLSQIFGVVGNVLPSTTATPFGAIFKALNHSALILGSIVVIYTIVMGLLKTATEGEFLGQKGNIWTPIRIVFGIAGLFPTSGGYCIIQIILMWIILQGVGAADYIWNTWINVQYNIGSGSTAPPIAAQGNTAQQFRTLFQSLICQATAAKTDKGLESGPGYKLYFCADNPTDPFCKLGPGQMLSVTGGNVTPSDTQMVWALGPAGQIGCGSVTYPNPTNPAYIVNGQFQVSPSPATQPNGQPWPKLQCPTASTDKNTVIACAAAQAQPQALQNAVSVLGALANSIVNYDNQYLNFNENAPPYYNSSNPAPGSSAPGPTKLAWLNNYCSAKNMACCLEQNPNNNGACDPHPANCYFSNPGCNPFPADTETSKGGWGMDPGNFANNALYSYAMTDLLGSNVSTVMQTVMTQYNATINAAIAAAMGQVPPPAGSPLLDAEAGGWITAGAYYYQIAKMSGATQGAQSQFGIFTAIAPPSGPLALQQHRNNVDASSTIADVISGPTGAPGSAANPPEVNAANNLLNSAAQGIMSGFMQTLTGGGDPIANLASFGENLLIAGQVIYPVFIAIGAVLTLVSNIAVIGLGTGLVSTPGGAVIKFLLTGLGMLVVLLVGLMFTYGGIFAIYIPLIPYMIFTFAAIGWFMSCIEAMVAGPFVALGILAGGEHEILGRANPAIGMVFGIFLRPGLMIVGFAFAFVLVKVALALVNNTFLAVMGQINSNPGPVELFLFMGAYTTLILSVINKCFSLISEVPDRVLGWISFQYKGFEGGEAGEVGKETQGAAKGMGGSAEKSAGGSMASAAKAHGKAGEAQAKADPAGAAKERKENRIMPSLSRGKKDE